MFSYLKELFNTHEENSNKETLEYNHKLQIAACALLLEIANADDNFSENEQIKITEIMKSQFELNEIEIEQLFTKSEEKIKSSVSLYEISEILNKNLNFEEKYQIIKNLWKVAYSDGNLDEYEDYYIKKIGKNFHFHHKDIMAAKIEVKSNL